MAKKRNIIVGQSGGPTSVINSSLAGVYKNAIENLNNSMYFENAPEYYIYETQTFDIDSVVDGKFNYLLSKKFDKIYKDDTIFKHPNYSYDEAIKIAYENSPDIKALVMTKEAMKQALLYVKRNYYPEINLGAGYDFINNHLKCFCGEKIDGIVEYEEMTISREYDEIVMG